MPLVLVGSKNPAKLKAVESGFKAYFCDVVVRGIDVPSGVSAQPIGEETFRGAENRVRHLQRLGKADYYCAIEGGLVKNYGRVFCFGVACISDGKRMAFATSPYFAIPEEFQEAFHAKKELGEIAKAYTGDESVKKEKGVVGYLTEGRITREELYIPAVVLALAELRWAKNDSNRGEEKCRQNHVW